MKIHIIGNIASGKSFLAKKLSEKIKYSILSIDNYRFSTNNFVGISGEKLSWMTFENTVVSTENCITESTGVSYHFQSLITLAPGLIIKVATPWKQCLKNHKARVKNENWQAPPMPYNFNLSESLQRNEYLLSKIVADIEFNPDKEEEFWTIVLPILNV